MREEENKEDYREVRQLVRGQTTEETVGGVCEDKASKYKCFSFHFFSLFRCKLQQNNIC